MLYYSILYIEQTFDILNYEHLDLPPQMVNTVIRNHKKCLNTEKIDYHNKFLGQVKLDLTN